MTINTKQTASIVLAILCGLSAMNARACDCLISKNWNKAQCAGKTPTLPSGGSVTGTQSQSQSGTNTSTNKVSSSNAVNTNLSLQTGAQSSTAKGGAGGNSVATAGASTSSNVVGPTTNTAQAGAGGSGGAGGTGTSSASANATGNSGAASNGNSSTYNSTYAAARIPVATALAGVQNTTAACRYAEGLGLQLTSAGTSVGFTFKDHDCERAALADAFYARGQNQAGDLIECQIKTVRDALGADCVTILGMRTVDDGGPERTDAVTHAELEAVEKRIVTRTLSK